MQFDQLRIQLLDPAGSNRLTRLNHCHPNAQSVNQSHNRLQTADILTNICLCKFKIIR